MIIDKITAEGIRYQNSSGEDVFLSFADCNMNWIAYRKRTESLDDAQLANIERNDRTVGQRGFDTAKVFIEFFSRPFTRFEFNYHDQLDLYRDIRDTIQKYGWATHDLS